jgi:hypothetical protein
MKAYDRAEEQRHSFLTYAPDQDEWSNPRHCHFNPGEWVASRKQSQVGPTADLDVSDNKKCLLHLPELGYLVAQPIA